MNQPISDVDQKLVDTLRARCDAELPNQYGAHDFNLLRWISHAKKLVKQGGDDKIIGQAERSLKHHLRYRQAWGLDDKEPVTWDENPLYTQQLLPRGVLIDQTDNKNRIPWLIDYGSLDLFGVSRSHPNSSVLTWCVWQFEHMLNLVVAQEKLTNHRSAIHHVADLGTVSFNPFEYRFATDGQLAYWTSFMHFEMYPELVDPLAFVNSPFWATWVHKLMSMALSGPLISRIHAYDHNFYPRLLEDFPATVLPDYYGGCNPKSQELRTIPAKKLGPEDFFLTKQAEATGELGATISVTDCSVVVVNGKRRRFIPISIGRAGAKINWYFVCDDVTFGIFRLSDVSSVDTNPTSTKSVKRKKSIRHPFGNSDNAAFIRIGGNRNSTDDEKREKNERRKSAAETSGAVDKTTSPIGGRDIDHMDMIYPFIRVAARHVPEVGVVTCERPGLYYVVFCNKHSWLTKRTINLKLDVENDVESNGNSTAFQRTFSL